MGDSKETIIPATEDNKRSFSSFLVSRLTTRNIIYLEELIKLLLVVTKNDLAKLIEVTLKQFTDEIKRDPKSYPKLSEASNTRIQNVCKEAVGGQYPIPDGELIVKSFGPPTLVKSQEVIADVQPRLEIHDFIQNKIQRDLFLQAYRDIQVSKPGDVWRSFYRIAGIHGAPYAPYNGDPNFTEQNTGYCHHGSVLFPSWHRAYMLLMENTVRQAAMAVAKKYNDEKYIIEAHKLRFPYFDWASEVCVYEGLPAILTDEQVTVTPPEGSPATFPNPLRSFNFPDTLGKVIYGEGTNPSQRPYVPIDGTPYSPAGTQTIRHPNTEFKTNLDGLNLRVCQYAAKVLRPNVWHMFQVNKYLPFSNHYAYVDQKEDVVTTDAPYGHFASLEVAHDAFHDAIGGTGGHMSYPAVAAFDPIFFIHHMNVDRLYALWQKCYPNEKIVPSAVPDGTSTIPAGDEADAKTKLTPFRGPTGEFLISNDLLDTKPWGYTYPELVLEEKREKEAEKVDSKSEDVESVTPSNPFLDQLLLKYHPDGHFDVRWQVAFPEIPKRELGGPFAIHVFIDLAIAADPTIPWTPAYLRTPNYCGSIAVFARDKDDNCPMCVKKPLMRGVVDITDTMFKLGISVNDEGVIMSNDDKFDTPITDMDSNPLSNQYALQVLVIKAGQRLTFKDVGIDPSTIRLQCIKTVRDIIDEKEDSKTIIGKKLKHLIFPNFPIAAALTKNVINQLVVAKKTILHPKVKLVVNKVPFIDSNLTGLPKTTKTVTTTTTTTTSTA